MPGPPRNPPLSPFFKGGNSGLFYWNQACRGIPRFAGHRASTPPFEKGRMGGISRGRVLSTGKAFPNE